VIKGRLWRWVLLILLVGAAASAIWHVLWFPVLMLSGC
jgi:hypothetical protein